MWSYEWRGPQTDKHLPQSPFTGQFIWITTFGIAFYQSNLSTVLGTMVVEGVNKVAQSVVVLFAPPPTALIN